MKIAVGEFIHETNSFCAKNTPLEQFYKQGEFCGTGILLEQELLKGHTGIETGLGGFIEKCSEYNWDIVPTIAADTLPSGTIEKSAYKFIKEKMVSIIEKNQLLDGVLLHLHGAALVEDMDDCEGDLLAAIRNAAGNVPIIVILDLHANVTPVMVEKSDVILGYNLEPHEDIYDRGLEAGDIMKNILDGKISNFVTEYRQPPMILPAINMATADNPMKKLFNDVYRWEENAEVINVSVFGGFYGSDQYNAGPSVIATVINGNRKLAIEIVEELEKKIWEYREEFIIKVENIDEVVVKAKDNGGLWALIDEADDPAGGGSCEGTEILASLLRNNVSSAGIATICDPEIVEQAFNAGVGETIENLLGCKTDDLHGVPVHIKGTVDLLRTDPIPWDNWCENEIMQNVGRIAVLNIENIIVVVTEMKAVTENIDIFEILGYDVTSMNIVGLKGLGLHLKEAYGDKVNHYVAADGKGVTHPDLHKIGTYYNLRRPCFPIDDM